MHLKIIEKKIIITVFFILILASDLSFGMSFNQWKIQYVEQAAKRGIPRKFSKKILSQIKVNQKIIKKDQNQIVLSKKHNYKEFMSRWLKNGERVATAKKMLLKHRELLNKIEKKYNVDKEVIVSLWGVETLFGQITGDNNVIESLATLAFEGRRRKFYEIQLNAAMRLLLKGHVSFENFKGSWAGATGDCQFMPSNILVYGQDFDNDGVIDIWNNKADIFASIAYLLKRAGWKKAHSIGSLVTSPKSLKNVDLDKYKTPQAYNELGFRQLSGKKISTTSWNARRGAKIPMEDSPVILRGSNYSSILKWNNSSLFAAFNIIMMDGLKKL